MSETGSVWSLTYLDEARFFRDVSDLPANTRYVLKVALESILLVEGIDLAAGPWLKSLGGGLWEFRIGPSLKAVFSKANVSSPLPVTNTRILIRMYCTFRNRQILLIGLFDKQRYGSGKRQAKSIENARKQLLTFQKER
jgi:hypothetical protein